MSFSTGYSAAQIWEATLGQLLLRVTRQNYDTWLRNTAGLRFEGTTIIVAAPNDLTCDWLTTRLRSVVAQALSAVAGGGISARFEPAASASLANENTPLQPSLLPRSAASLNPRFTFATFLPASFNQLALAAARNVIDSDSCYSPLFITGSSGSGKTHLLHSIAHEARTGGVRLLLVGADQFLNEFTTAIRTHGGAAFRARYRELDLLLVDDVHQLLGKKATLNEFYQTVAGLHDQGRSIVVAGDVSAMNGDAARFQSELNWGLVAPIDHAPVEDRVRFVKAKAEFQGIHLPEEVQHYLAIRVKSSVRDLEGAVNRVAAIARISNEPITIDFAARALLPVSTAPVSLKPILAPKDLLQAVSRHLDIAVADITSQRRERAITYARHITMYILRQDGGLTYSAIAQMMGKKDHSTVVHACTQIHNELKLSPTLRADIDAIKTIVHRDSSTLAS